MLPPDPARLPGRLAVARELTSAATTRVNFTPARLPLRRTCRAGTSPSSASSRKGLVLDVAYVGTHGTKLMILGDWNQAAPNSGARASRSTSAGRSRVFRSSRLRAAAAPPRTTAPQTKLEKRFAGGAVPSEFFTWSKAIDYGSGHLETGNGDISRLNIRDVPNERGVSGYDRTFNDTRPLPTGSRSAQGMAEHTFIGGWRTSLINSMYSGQPVTLSGRPAAVRQLSTVLTTVPTCSATPGPRGLSGPRPTT